jgi:ubiquinone/menaquinone biosynthesis C-methylase UbiE
MSGLESTLESPYARLDAFEAEPADVHVHLAQMVMAIWPARAIYAAAQLAIPDHLAQGALHLDVLSRLTATHAPSLKRLLRALASCGIVTEASPGRFSLTRLGSALRTDSPGSARALVMTIAGDWQWNAWGNFLHSLRTGQCGLLKSTGHELFSYLAAHPDDRVCFNQAMIGIHGAELSAVAAAYDFTAFESIVDVGGGTGTLLTEILMTVPHTHGFLFDLPETAKEARKVMAAEGLSDRCTISEGDFFEAIPESHDCYILAHVLHDWTDELALKILENCHRAISRHGRLLVIEAILPEGDVPHHGKLMDLLMLTVTGGLERTEQEFSQLLNAAGFTLRRVIPTNTHQSIIEATPHY